LDYSSNFKISCKRDKERRERRRRYVRAKRLRLRLARPRNSFRLACKHSLFLLSRWHRRGIVNSYGRAPNIRVSSFAFFYKPTQRKRFVLLRAPYRYKIARNPIMFKRFFVKCVISLTVKSKLGAVRLLNSYKPI